MLCKTHQLIANQAYEALISELKVTLDRESLLEGSIAPDSNPLMLLIPHFKNGQSLGFLNRYIDKLQNTCFTDSEEILKEFSFRLGVIIHYISDYFCRAHNDVWYLNPITHYFYEKRLKTYFSNCISRAKLFVKTDSYKFIDTIRNFIEKRHEEYLSGERNMEKDFSFTMEAIIAVSLNIVSESLRRPVPEFIVQASLLESKTA